MSAPGTSSRGRSAIGRYWWVLLVIVVIAVAFVLGGTDRRGGPPLDPRSTDPDGTRALVLLLERYARQVGVSSSPGGAGTALLLVDDLDEPDRRELERWVSGGGVLVVADPTSSFAPPIAGSVGALTDHTGSAIGRGFCNIEALADVDALDVGAGSAFSTDDVDTSCFGEVRRAFVTVTGLGSGEVVALGSADPFTNERLGELDNALAAVSLLAPNSERSVVVLEPPGPGEGPDDLYDVFGDLWALVGPGPRQALVQLVVAFVVYALWRARRLGRPVADHVPVRVPSAELVRGVAALLGRTANPQRSADLVRRALRRDLARRVGLPADSPAGDVATAVAPLSRHERSTIEQLLGDHPVADDDELVALMGPTESLRREVLDGRDP
ncbi:MAG: DUF4350 domain-containing protein [Actinomycetota bacterium]|nr:DUF4350 domain-containing protein [Actinomycetota bacterium]